MNYRYHDMRPLINQPLSDEGPVDEGKQKAIEKVLGIRDKVREELGIDEEFDGAELRNYRFDLTL